MDSTNLIIIGSICFSAIIMDFVLFGIILNTRQKVKQAENWPPTMGTVTVSTVDWRRGSKGSSVAYANVRYAYQVAGNAYESNKIYPGVEMGGTGTHKIVERYPAGTQVMVYYDPQDPSKALLERSTPGYIKWLWVTVILTDLFLCALAVVLAYAL